MQPKVLCRRFRLQNIPMQQKRSARSDDISPYALRRMYSFFVPAKRLSRSCCHRGVRTCLYIRRFSPESSFTARISSRSSRIRRLLRSSAFFQRQYTASLSPGALHIFLTE